MCNNPVLKTQSQFLADVKDVIGKRTPTDKSLIVAINQALISSGIAGRSCMCIEWGCLTCGQCEFDLPCCDIDSIVPEVKGVGCASGDCWTRLPWWDVRCGKLVTDGTISGQLRLTIYAQNPEFGTAPLSLVKTMLAGDTDLWVEGRVENLPSTGWIKVCNEWMQYLCVEHREAPKPDTIAINAAPIDPIDGLPGEESFAWGVDPAVGFSSGEAPCGTHTVLHGLRRRCNAQGDDNYAPGTVVELGLALSDAASLDYLQDKILANSYRTLAASCVSGEDRQFYLQMFADSDARAADALRRRKPIKAIVKQRNQFALQTGCCGAYVGCGV